MKLPMASDRDRVEGWQGAAAMLGKRMATSLAMWGRTHTHWPTACVTPQQEGIEATNLYPTGGHLSNGDSPHLPLRQGEVIYNARPIKNVLEDESFLGMGV
uniref:Uncharacterized protein n=1 Tax=Eutreptiella gymnastica TaxID=73025 RepID=A0A7S1JHG7_9EUGL|mmetsp:Transcript_9823/g.17348  ORF Transcript_9823/g.17348 Transcript_9823/m.17348 type:complete len:101 (+) Transcript_9823:151-453(+)